MDNAAEIMLEWYWPNVRNNLQTTNLKIRKSIEVTGAAPTKAWHLVASKDFKSLCLLTVWDGKWHIEHYW